MSKSFKQLCVEAGQEWLEEQEEDSVQWDTSKKRKYIIDRSRWVSGSSADNNKVGLGRSMLRNKEGFMCCLGFICKARGIKYLYEEMPARLDREIKDLTEKSYDGYSNTVLSLKAAKINDSPELSPEEREEQIIDLFSEHGIEIEFRGEYVHE